MSPAPAVDQAQQCGCARAAPEARVGGNAQIQPHCCAVRPARADAPQRERQPRRCVAVVDEAQRGAISIAPVHRVERQEVRDDARGALAHGQAVERWVSHVAVSV